MPENSQQQKRFRDPEERRTEAAKIIWKTAFIVLLSHDGKVYCDPSRQNFRNQLAHEATEDDAIYMLSMALEEFKQDRARRMVMEEVGKMLRTVAMSGK